METQAVPQVWSADTYRKLAPYVPALAQPVVELLAPRPGERILDVGCGDGALTRLLVQAGATVVGVDGSPDMIATAQAEGLDARVMDAQYLDFDEEFDAAFTNAALHWMPDQPAVYAGVARALKPGGRFVGEFGGHGNVAAMRTAIYAVLARRGIDAASRDPFHFVSEAQLRADLAEAGLTPVQVQLIPRPTRMASGVRGWIRTFGTAWLAALQPEDRDIFLDEVDALLRPTLQDETGTWVGDYVRLRFHAVKA